MVQRACSSPACPPEPSGSPFCHQEVQTASRKNRPDGLRIATYHGPYEQLFGTNRQVLHEGKCYRRATGSAAQFLWASASLARPVAGSVLPVFPKNAIEISKTFREDLALLALLQGTRGELK